MIRIRPDPNFADTNGTFGLYKKLLATVFRNFSRLNSFFKVFMFWKDPEPSKQTICIGSGSELNYSDPATPKIFEGEEARPLFRGFFFIVLLQNYL